MHRILWPLITLLTFGFHASSQTVAVTAEESVYTFANPDNGSGPFWSQGCTSIARLGDRVFASQVETGEGIPRLCNTRWRLLERDEDAGTWRLVTQANEYRQREPVSLGVGGDTTLYLNVNDSLTSPGEEYKDCHPHLLRLGMSDDGFGVNAVNPTWNVKPYFTDHSYRGFATDGPSHEILMLNIDAKTSKEHYALLDQYGVTRANGEIVYPIRSCYPYVALKQRAAHVLAITDIVEPIQEWREYKYAQTQQKWDYVFRISYYTWSPDLTKEGFATPLEIANVDATGGAISNQDLWIAPDNTAYILYSEREVQSALMRDKFFPGKSLLNSLHLVVIKEGKIIKRQILVEGTDSRQAGRAQLHECPDGRVFAMVNITGEGAGNKLVQLYPDTETLNFMDIPFEIPFNTFTLASVRAGNAPSDTIDVLGHQTAGTEITYGRIEIR